MHALMHFIQQHNNTRMYMSKTKKKRKKKKKKEREKCFPQVHLFVSDKKLIIIKKKENDIR